LVLGLSGLAVRGGLAAGAGLGARGCAVSLVLLPLLLLPLLLLLLLLGAHFLYMGAHLAEVAGGRHHIHGIYCVLPLVLSRRPLLLPLPLLALRLLLLLPLLLPPVLLSLLLLLLLLQLLLLLVLRPCLRQCALLRCRLGRRRGHGRCQMGRRGRRCI
jgi:hypothetical protein